MTDPLFDIQDQVILVPGGARGLGRSLAEALAERGARIVIADRLAEEGEAAAGDLPGDGHMFQTLDLCDETSVAVAVARTQEHCGRLDVVLNSAGIGQMAPALELSAEDFRKTVDVNLTGAFLISQKAARVMCQQQHGRIIHLASVSSRVVNPNYAAYSSSKAALAQLVKVLALEWVSYGITVNAIGPAMTPTPLTEAKVLRDEASRAQALSQIPAGRFGKPEDLVGTAVLLASSAGAFITGQTVYVDGGRTLV